MAAAAGSAARGRGSRGRQGPPAEDLRRHRRRILLLASSASSSSPRSSAAPRLGFRPAPTGAALRRRPFRSRRPAAPAPASSSALARSIARLRTRDVFKPQVSTRRAAARERRVPRSRQGPGRAAEELRRQGPVHPPGEPAVGDTRLGRRSTRPPTPAGTERRPPAKAAGAGYIVVVGSIPGIGAASAAGGRPRARRGAERRPEGRRRERRRARARPAPHRTSRSTPGPTSSQSTAQIELVARAPQRLSACARPAASEHIRKGVLAP